MFYYWDYYKEVEPKSYISPKYRTLKEEIANHKVENFDINVYENIVVYPES